MLCKRFCCLEFIRVLLNLGEVAWAQALWWGMRDKEAHGRGGGGGGGKAAEYFAHAPLLLSFSSLAVWPPSPVHRLIGTPFC